MNVEVPYRYLYLRLICRWGCDDVYREIDKANIDITKLEESIDKLVEQAILFEVIVPEFKIIKTVRKELKMAKAREHFLH